MMINLKILEYINSVKNSRNPDEAMTNLMNSDPQFQDIQNYIMTNGGDARTAFYNLAAQMGVDPESILKQLR